MSESYAVRRGWLKGMYIYTIVGAGALGLGVVVAPDVMRSMSGLPDEDPIVFGVMGSVYVAFGVLSVLGLRDPLKFAPVLMLQLCYKSVWFIGVILPLVVAGTFPAYAWSFVLVFATYIIGDVIAIPWRYFFAGRGVTTHRGGVA